MLNWGEQNIYLQISDVLNNDGIVLAPSDTVIGLFGRLSEESKKQLDIIKERDLKPYIVLIRSIKLLDYFTDQKIDTTLQQIMEKYWPGPLTIIFKAKATLPDWMISHDGNIAIRVPDHQGLQNVLQKEKGLFTTSANISGQPVPYSYETIDSKILNRVQLVCCQKNKIYDGLASTIIDVSSGSIKVIRLGQVLIDSI